ncbi:clusterin-associated protein 1-like isoform X1 [Macrobrachium rosenbergii]|uniref:clusterin-associated protein 1-like isoform X1 n=3 Tax=Macrobrachium rosenbergii TaxID=79674 RepID=UPI0034D6E5D9
MSYREIRNLIEHTKVLGFHRVISMENFSTPNFPLVSEILIWAMKIVDSDYEVSSVIDFEPDRVVLIRIAAVFFYQKMGIKINTVKLYGADKLAVRELLKVTTRLYAATQTALHSAPVSEDSEELEANLTVNLNGKDLREFRQLASSIVMDAATLHDSLNNEIDAKIKREVTLNQALDIDRLEATLVSALHALSATVAELKETTQQLEKQKAEVEEKLEKKRESLVRNRRRLEALNRIKPAWQTEFEDEEAELRKAWEEYVTKHKTLAYLENQLQLLEDQQIHNLDVAMQMGKEATVADLRNSEDAKEHLQTQSRRLFGSMTGEGLDTSDSESTDSFLNDSASDDDSLTLLSKEESTEKGLGLKKGSPLSKTREDLQDHSLYTKQGYKSLSGRQVQRRPSSARPKSAHTESRVNNLSAWTGSVKGSGRVSPLSASEDNSDGF